MRYILGKNDCGWYIWSSKDNGWLHCGGCWTQDASVVHWSDPYPLIRLFKKIFGSMTLEVGNVSNI